MQASKHDRAFMRMVEFSTGLSLGLMTGFLFSIQRVNPRIEFAITGWSLAAFVVSGFLCWMASHLFFRRLLALDEGRAEGGLDKKRLLFRWLIFFAVALVIESILGVIHGLRGIESSQLGQVLQGMGAAFFVVSLAGFVFWKLTRFVESDAPPPHLRDRDGE
jgi:hypothetical protein